MTLSLPIDPEATKLLYNNPLSLILGMLLDQHMVSLWKNASF